MILTHIRLLVANFGQCFNFYKNILELPSVWGDPDSQYASFKLDEGCMIALFKRELMAEAVGTQNLPGDVPTQDRVALIIQVDDLEVKVAELRSRGVDFVNEARIYPDWGIRAAHLRDPAGNLIELWEPLPQECWSDRLVKQAVKYMDEN